MDTRTRISKEKEYVGRSGSGNDTLAVVLRDLNGEFEPFCFGGQKELMYALKNRTE
jgi:hypothetical protein